jgi:hypothetical protein
VVVVVVVLLILLLLLLLYTSIGVLRIPVRVSKFYKSALSFV